MENLSQSFQSLSDEANALAMTINIDSGGQEECAALRDRALDFAMLRIGTRADLTKLSMELAAIRLHRAPASLIGAANARLLSDQDLANAAQRVAAGPRAGVTLPVVPDPKAPPVARMVKPAGRENRTFDQSLRESYEAGQSDTEFANIVERVREAARRLP